MPSHADLPWRTLADVFRRLEAAYPEEGCGFVRASGDVRAVRNAAAAPHTTFTFGDEDLLAFERAFAESDPPIVIYHGHPDAPPVFSWRDADGALLDGAPLYPVRHLVVEVRQGQAHRYALYGFGGGRFSLEQSGPAGGRPWFA